MTLAFRTDAHARRLIVRMSAKEDIALGWQVEGDAALKVILARLAARKIAVEEVAGEEAALRGVARFWRFLGPKRQAFELFTEPEVAPPVKTLVSAFVTGERGLGHVAITTRKPETIIAFWQRSSTRRSPTTSRPHLRRRPSFHLSTRQSAPSLDRRRRDEKDRDGPVCDQNPASQMQRRRLTTSASLPSLPRPGLEDRNGGSTAPQRSRRLVLRRDAVGVLFRTGWSSEGDSEAEAWPQVTHQGISVWGQKTIRVGLHVCGGNPRRKRVYFTKYTDLALAFRKMKIDEVLLEHCTLSYDLMDLWNLWDFKGDLGLGVIDQRSDDIETIDVIRKRVEPALKHFPRERLILTSECGFGHVPLDITRRKLAVLVEASHSL